ncbi:MAG TPA: DUF5675 family protein [bacterium]|nr:DUF5675 family protein [bacterium]
MIILNHKRTVFEKTYCFSELYFNNEKFICYLLEDADRDLAQGKDTIEGIKKIKSLYPKAVAIPYGEYILGWRWSNSLSHRYTDLADDFPELINEYKGIKGLLLPHIKDVKGFEYIMYHTGQFEYHTAGCPLTRINTDYGKFAGSKEAFIKLMTKLYNCRKDIFAGNAIVIIEKDAA